MHNSKRIRRMIIAIALIIVILLGLDYILYPCTFMRNDIHTVTTQKHQDIFMGKDEYRSQNNFIRDRKDRT